MPSLPAPLTTHPAYQPLVSVYRSARADWARSEPIRNAAATFGMDERAYCDARVRDSQLAWAATDTTGPITREHLDAAFAESAQLSRNERKR